MKFLAGLMLFLLPPLNDFYRGYQYDGSLSSGCGFALLGWAIFSGLPWLLSRQKPD
jgi:hypothetical protein